MSEWRAIVQRLEDAGAKFVVEPRVRFAGQAGEQATSFVLDRSGYALEFKAFGNPDRLFEKQPETPAILIAVCEQSLM